MHGETKKNIYGYIKSTEIFEIKLPKQKGLTKKR